jgi:hypothetical protein
LNTLTSFFINALYSLTAGSITYSTILASSFLHLTMTSGSINLMSPYTPMIILSTLYLNQEVLAQLLVLTLVMSQLLHHLVLGFLVQFLDQSVDCLHFLDSCGILLC